jgi:hypothetical protein
MRPPCASSRGSHPRTSPRSPSRSTRTASRSTPRRNVGAIRRARESVSFAARTRGARREAPERSDASCGDRRRRRVSRALRNARAARRRRRAAALLKVEKIMGIQNVRATARESASGGPGCLARSLRSDGEFQTPSRAEKNRRLNSHTVCHATRSFRRRYFVALRRARLRPARRTIKRRPAERPIPLYKSPPCVLEPAHYPLTTPFP